MEQKKNKHKEMRLESSECVGMVNIALDSQSLALKHPLPFLLFPEIWTHK